MYWTIVFSLPTYTNFNTGLQQCIFSSTWVAVIQYQVGLLKDQLGLVFLCHLNAEP